MKVIGVHNIMWKIYFSPLLNDARSGFYFYMVVDFYFIALPVFFSVPTRFILYNIRNFDCSVQSFALKEQLKKWNETDRKTIFFLLFWECGIISSGADRVKTFRGKHFMHDIICITCIYLILFDKVAYFAHKLILDLMREKYCLILMYNLKITQKLV